MYISSIVLFVLIFSIPPRRMKAPPPQCRSGRCSSHCLFFFLLCGCALCIGSAGSIPRSAGGVHVCHTATRKTRLSAHASGRKPLPLASLHVCDFFPLQSRWFFLTVEEKNSKRCRRTCFCFLFFGVFFFCVGAVCFVYVSVGINKIRVLSYFTIVSQFFLPLHLNRRDRFWCSLTFFFLTHVLHSLFVCFLVFLCTSLLFSQHGALSPFPRLFDWWHCIAYVRGLSHVKQ